jgi:hypothetical protein
MHDRNRLPAAPGEQAPVCGNDTCGDVGRRRHGGHIHVEVTAMQVDGNDAALTLSTRRFIAIFS